MASMKLLSRRPVPPVKFHHRALLPLILLFGAFSRFFELGRESLWYDELYTVWSSRLPLGSLVQEEAAARHPPVFYLIGHFWFSLFRSDSGERMLSALAGVAAIWLTYRIGKELFSRKVGLWAAGFAAVSPFLIWYSREATYYSWVTSVSLLSLYLLLRALNSGGRLLWSGYLFATSLALFSYFYSPVLLVAELAVFLQLRQKGRTVRPFTLGFSVLSLEAGATVILAFVYRVPGMIGFTTLSAFMTQLLKDLAHSPFLFVEGPLDNPHAFTSGQKLILVITLAFGPALAAFPRLRNIFKERRSRAIIAYTVILVLGPLTLFALLNDPSGPFRFYSWAAPTFAIIVAVFITAIPQKFQIAVGILIICLTTFFFVRPELQINIWDFRDVMKTVAANEKSGDGLLCFPLNHCVVAAGQYPTGLTMFAGFIDGNRADINLPWHGYFGVKPPVVWLSDGDLSVALAKKLAGKNRVWVIGGDGTAADYPRVDFIYKELSGDWQEAGSWDIKPFCLKLFEHKTRSHATA